MDFPPIKLYGALKFARTGCVSIHTEEVCPNGIVGRVVVEVEGDFSFQVKTFFYGYNIKCFVEGVEEVLVRRIEADARLRKKEDVDGFIASLNNYDERLQLEIICREEIGDFLSVRYIPMLLHSVEEEIEAELRKVSRVSASGPWGSEFYLMFMKLGSRIHEHADVLRNWLHSLKISCDNPYPGGEEL